jgi:hypothetical protein
MIKPDHDYHDVMRFLIRSALFTIAFVTLFCVWVYQSCKAPTVQRVAYSQQVPR